MTSNSRIVLDLRAAHPGLTGIGRYALNLAPSLEAIGCREACALVTAAGRELVEQTSGLRLVEVAAGTPLWDELVLPGLLRDLGAEVYHSPLPCLPAIHSCGYVCTIHDVIPLARPDLTPPEFAAYFNIQFPRALRRADRIVAVSNHAREDLLRHSRFEAERVRVIWETVSPRFLPTSTSEHRTLSRYDLKPGYFLSVGAFDRRKNLGLVLDAYSNLTTERSILPQIIFVGAPSGDGYRLADEIGRRKLEGRARVLGRVAEPDLPAIYGGALALVFPSLYEGFGLPVLEAMACGTPVLCSTAASLPEVADDAALLFDPVRPEALAERFREILDHPDLRQHLRSAGLRRATRFSLRAQGEGLLDLYDGLRRKAA